MVWRLTSCIALPSTCVISGLRHLPANLRTRVLNVGDAFRRLTPDLGGIQASIPSTLPIEGVRSLFGLAIVGLASDLGDAFTGECGRDPGRCSCPA